MYTIDIDNISKLVLAKTAVFLGMTTTGRSISPMFAMMMLARWERGWFTLTTPYGQCHNAQH
jgi:hypothetical protein